MWRYQEFFYFKILCKFLLLQIIYFFKNIHKCLLWLPFQYFRKSFWYLIIFLYATALALKIGFSTKKSRTVLFQKFIKTFFPIIYFLKFFAFLRSVTFCLKKSAFILNIAETFLSFFLSFRPGASKKTFS